jgi:tetratricopeptide (TPR) repeat protein
LDVDIPGLESVDVTDGLLGAEPAETQLVMDDAVQDVSGAPAADEFEGPITLSSEDEEHIKEKLTEAEVFVRYGLVDKAVDQLKDVLESFRFHTEAREKLIEIYKDQGMNREAAEQVAELARFYEGRGEGETAERLLQEARELNPALEEAAVEGGVSAEEELELTLTPEEDLEGVGLETDFVAETEGPGLGEELPVSEPELPEALAVDDEAFAEPSSPVLTAEGAEDEVELTLEESGEVPVGIELDQEGPAVASEAAVSGDELGAHEDISEIAVEEEIPVAGEEELAEVADLAFDNEASGILEDVPVEAGMEDGAEIDLQLPSTESPAAEQEFLVGDVPDEGEDFHVALDVESLPVEDEGGELSVEIPDVAIDTPGPEEPVVEMELPGVAPPAEPISETTAATAGAAVSTELEEVDEYIALGLYEDARDTLRELLKRSPGNPAVLGKIEELGFSASQLQKEAASPPSQPEVAEVSLPSDIPLEIPPPAAASEEFGAPQQEEPLASIGGFGEPESLEPGVHAAPESTSAPFVDLASELSQEMFGTQSAVEDEKAVEEPVEALSDPGLDEIFREFKKGVEKQLGTEDYDTRYNLGIAYKEMGLLDEAIAEFQLAAKDDARLLECCSMLGLCFMEKGMAEIAIKWFEKGLGAPGRSEEEYHGLRYDLAQAHEAVGNTERALELYMEIYRVNARFRDVRDRVRELQAAKNW